MLYSERGQYNPHAARAERKRAKREARGGVITGLAAEGLAGLKLGLGDNEEYDFDEAFDQEDGAAGKSTEGQRVDDQGLSDEEDEQVGADLDDGDTSVEDLA